MDTVPEDADRDITVSVFIVDEDRVLLIDHKKLGMWIQPGGHIEENELPDEAAKREAIEETGVTVELVDYHGNGSLSSTSRVTPWDSNFHQVTKSHYHYDISFLARPRNIDDNHQSDEHNGQQWFASSELSDEVDNDTALRATAAIEAFNT